MRHHGFRRLGKSPWTLILLGSTLLSFVVLLQPALKGQVVPATARQTDLDQPLAWLKEARRNYSVVKDYTCTLVSQENVRGKLQEQNVMQFKMKTEPFSIHMRWIAPEKNQNQEVAFVLGKNNNKMRVRSNILGGKIFVSIDPNDKRVMEHSRHTILEAGIGNMIEQHINQWEKDRAIGKTKVNIPAAEHVYAGRKCYKVELIRTERNPAFYCHRTVIYLEKESKIPIRLENYDWPRKGGPEGGELLEMFGYVNLQFNTGLKDAEFDK
jgi:hypothetical protein